MEIHSLKMSIPEADLNALLAEMPAGKSAVEKLRVRLSPEGIVILGEYPTMLMRMSFETLWEVTGLGSIVQARLASVKVSGLPAGMLRGVLLKTLREMLAKEPGASVQEETIQVDLSKLSSLQKIHLKINLTAVRCEAGLFSIEAGQALA